MPPLDPFGATARRWVAAAWLTTAALGLASALVRLLPWLLDARVAWSTAGVFARGLAAVGLETSCAVALPLGYALAAAAMNDRGEGLACMLCGASPWRLVARSWPVAAAVAALGAGVGLLWGHEAAHPGEAASALIAAARGGCGGRAVSEVPGVGASWLCRPGEAPWLVLASAAAVAQARSADVAPDLKTLALRDARLALRGPPAVSIEVDEAEIASGRAYGHAAVGWPRARALGAAAAAAAGAFAAAAALLGRGDGRRGAALALGLAAALGPLLLRRAVDDALLAPAWLLAQPALAAAPGLLWAARRSSHAGVATP